MKKIILLLLVIGFGNAAIAQNLSDCKKTCEVQEVIEKGAFLGVRIVTHPTKHYVRVAEIVPNTAAQQNKLAQNDIITKIDGISMVNNQQVIKLLSTHEPNDVIKLTFTRNGKTMKKRIALGAKFTKLVTKTICCDEPAESKTATNNLVPGGINYTIYPNPAVNSLQINSDVSVEGTVEINVFDMIGNQIINEVITSRNQVVNQKLSLDALSSGTYLVKIMNQDVVSVVKLVVSK